MEKKAIKVIGFNGSPKARGNTWWMLTKMFDVFKDNGVETELVHIGNKKIHGCMHCMQCVGQGKCTIDTDIVNESVEKIKKSDGMILATPVYFAGPSGQMKLFMDRVAFGGHLDIESTARIVLRDWNRGKIIYYSIPPVQEQNKEDSESVIVTEFAKELNLDDLLNDNLKEMDTFESKNNQQFDPFQNVQEEMEDLDFSDDNDNDNDNF